MTLGSGRRISVLIFSTSMMKEVYLAPIEYYDPNMVFVLLSNRKDDVSKLENEIYRSVKDRIPCNNITEYVLDTHSFDEVAGTLLEIKRNLRKTTDDKLDIFINISSGTNEYAAAGLLAAVTPPTDTVFNVVIEDDGLSSDELSAMYRDREHVISDPSIMTLIDKADPDEEFIALLDVLKEMLKISKYTKRRDIINRLKECGAWSYDENRKDSGKKTPLNIKEERYLERHYIEVAIQHDWIEKPTPNTLALTPKGNAYLEMCRDRLVPANDESRIFCCNKICSSDESSFKDEYIIPDVAKRKKRRKDALIVEHNGKSYRFTLSMK